MLNLEFEQHTTLLCLLLVTAQEEGRVTAALSLISMVYSRSRVNQKLSPVASQPARLLNPLIFPYLVPLNSTYLPTVVFFTPVGCNPAY